ncbi:alpha-2,8-sialyltransferase 8B-like [Ptychodera flava]|uniref:alpha-2,8-sialyltransferase 8B-like n=1 Tax=Ptychodera flava TaxID=63121 RepID=UPI00396A8284
MDVLRLSGNLLISAVRRNKAVFFVCLLLLSTFIYSKVNTLDSIIAISKDGTVIWHIPLVRSKPPRRTAIFPVNLTQRTINGAKQRTDEHSTAGIKSLLQFNYSETTSVKDITRELSLPWTHDVGNRDKIRKEMENYVDTKRTFVLTKGNVKIWEILQATIANSSFRVGPDLHRLLKKTPIFVNRTYNTCSIVGSGGILLNSRCGSHIDSAEAIIRLNLATLGPFVKDVGRKTTLSTLNKSQLKSFRGLMTRKDRRNLVNKVKVYENIAILMHSTSVDFDLTLRAARILQQHINIYFIHPNHFRGLWDYWKTKSLPKRPSSGFYMVSVAIANCEKVNVYGFWPYKYDVNGNIMRYHYYDKMHMSSSHSFIDEFRALRKLHQQGVIKLHVASCNGTSS